MGDAEVVASAIVATAAAIGAGVGIGNLIWANRPAPPPQTIILQLPPTGAPSR